MLSRRRSSRLWVRFGRYSIGSVIAVGCSELTFVLSFGPARLGATVASVAAFVAGAIPNYLINRYWAWGGRDRFRRSRETVLYIAVILLSLVVSIGASDAADAVSRHVSQAHTTETALVSLVYLGTQGVLFLVKFALFQRLVFIERPGP
jgi:putative flippase GtrA